MVEVGRTDIEAALRQLGTGDGDVLMAHSSLTSFGRVRGGADAVIDALLDVVGSGGTLVMPAFCQRDGELRFETWDVRLSPSDVGRITEVFRLRPGGVRSNHATHSVAACGRHAHEITQGHGKASRRPGPWGEAAFGVGCPWDVMYGFETKILLIGVDFMVNSTVHYVEHLIVERALNRVCAPQRSSMLRALRGWQKPGVWPSFDRLKLQRVLDDMGAVKRGTCGSSELLLVSLRTMVDEALRRMESDREEWFDAEFRAWTDVGRSNG